MTNANDLHETKTHGQLSFPYAVYKSDIPRDMRSFPLHWHDDAEIIYIESGSGVITVQSHEQKVGRGDIITVPPQSVHAIESERGMRYFNVLFNFSLLDNSANDVCYEKYLKPLYCQTELPPIFAERKSEYYKQLLPHVAYLIDNRHKIQRLPLAEHAHRSPLPGHGNKPVPVGLIALHGYEEIPGADLPGVVAHSGDLPVQVRPGGPNLYIL